MSFIALGILQIGTKPSSFCPFKVARANTKDVSSSLVPTATIKVFLLPGMDARDVSSCNVVMARMKAHPYSGAKW
jgi:hypothetical protein